MSSWHARENLAAATTKNGAASGRIDIATGLVLIGLSIALLAGSYAAAASLGGGTYFVAVGPFIYGMVRLLRGMEPKKA